MSEEWLMVIAVLALGLGLINTLSLLAYGAGLATRLEEWREEGQGRHRDLTRLLGATHEKLDRIERTMPHHYGDQAPPQAQAQAQAQAQEQEARG